MGLSKIFVFLISITVIADTLSDVYLKKWALSDNKMFMIIALLLLCGTGVFWGLSLRHEMLSKAVVIYNVVNVLLAVLAGIFLFKEVPNTYNLVGIFFGVLGLIFLSL